MPVTLLVTYRNRTSFDHDHFLPHSSEITNQKKKNKKKQYSVHPSFYPTGTGGSFPPGVKLRTHLYIVQGLTLELYWDTGNLD
jgi:hypothetical protein